MQLPIGTIVATLITNKDDAPDDWLFCDGSDISGAYAALYNLCHDKKTPDLRGRVLVSSGRTTDEKQTDGLTPNFPKDKTLYVGNTGGEYLHTLQIKEIPEHHHYITTSKHKMGKDNRYELYPYSKYETDISKKGKTGNEGGGEAHMTMQPYYVVNYLIYAGSTNSVSE